MKFLICALFAAAGAAGLTAIFRVVSDNMEDDAFDEELTAYAEMEQRKLLDLRSGDQ